MWEGFLVAPIRFWELPTVKLSVTRVLLAQFGLLPVASVEVKCYCFIMTLSLRSELFKIQDSHSSCLALQVSSTCQLGWWLVPIISIPEGRGRITMNLKPDCATDVTLSQIQIKQTKPSKAMAVILSFPEKTCKIGFFFFPCGLDWDCQVWWQWLCLMSHGTWQEWLLLIVLSHCFSNCLTPEVR